MDAHVHFVPKALTEVHIGGAKHTNGLSNASKLTNSLSNVHLGTLGHGSSTSLATTPGSSGQVSPRSEAAETLTERVKLTSARRIIVKVGRHVVSRNCDGRLALGRIGNLIEQLEGLVRSGREIILVTSGAVCSGVQRVRREQILNSTPLQLQSLNDDSAESGVDPAGSEMRAAAASGQSGLMSLYDLLFSHMDLSCSQFLVTRNDFLGTDFKKGIRQTVDRLLGMKTIPVFNWNDAIDFNRNPQNETGGNYGGYSAGRYWDNDTLSLLLAQALKVDLLMILTDVDGLFDHMPYDESDGSPQLIHTFCPEIHAPIVQYNCPKSKSAYHGMSSKADVAWKAAQAGIPAVVINGKGFRPTMMEALSGEMVGTLFDTKAARRMLKLHHMVPNHLNRASGQSGADSDGDSSCPGIELPHGHRRTSSQSRLAPSDAPKPPLHN